MTSRLVALGMWGKQVCGTGSGATCTPWPVAVWTSTDAQTWVRQPSSPVFDNATITSAASDSTQVIAVGDAGFHNPRIWSTADGAAWKSERLSPTIFRDAHIDAITAFADGWLIGGYLEHKEPICCLGGPPDMTPAIWYSSDGQVWQPATIVGAAPSYNEIDAIVAGGQGLLAAGYYNDDPVPWQSPDGRTWTQPSILPPNGLERSDGARILSVVPATSVVNTSASSAPTGPSMEVYVSTDARIWQLLTATGATDAMPNSSHLAQDELVTLATGLVIIDPFPGGSREEMWLATNKSQP